MRPGPHVFTPGVLETGSETETESAGESLGRTLGPGDVVLLYGELGAGKTAFVRGMARGVGANPDEVSSPTFTIVQEYTAPTWGHSQFSPAEIAVSVPVSVTLYHVDLYRLEPPEIDDLGLDDLISGDGIVAVEWADRWRGHPEDAIEVRLMELADERRRVTITGPIRAK
jgi:tRNA threonylcarbamoyladenosine biosynthesis protein TsaE